MRRVLLRGVLAAAGALVFASPAQAYFVWQEREINEEISFEGETDACDFDDTPDFTEDTHQQAIPGPARAVTIVAPETGRNLRLRGSSSVNIGSISAAFVTATNPFDQVVHITARGRVPFCPVSDTKWRAEPVDLKIKYEQRVYTPVPPVVDCREPFLTIHKLQAQRVSCAYAVGLARRYFSRARTLARRYLPPYRCLERPGTPRRFVYCYAPGRRNVRFRYGL